MNFTVIDWRRIILSGNRKLLSSQASESSFGLNYQLGRFVAAVLSWFLLCSQSKMRPFARFWLVRPIICVDSVNHVRICLGTTLHQ